jgi:hypothetical protein
MDTSLQHPPARGPIHYDAVRRRLWICGQRCHHGATGALLTAAAAGALLASALQPRRAITLLATGSALMAHDWHDRPLWFERGWQAQE